MRTNGMSAFPDPNSSGQLTIDGIANSTSLNPNTPAFQQALSACKDLEPPGFMGTQRTPQQQEAALKFAQCMRDNGITNFPDPTPNGPIINVNGAHSIPGSRPLDEVQRHLPGQLACRAGDAQEVGGGWGGGLGCRRHHRRGGRHVGFQATCPGYAGAASKHRESAKGGAVGHGLGRTGP